MPFPKEKIIGALERAGLLEGVRGNLPEFFELICDDSRKAVNGALFIAVRGSARDGHDFLDKAADLGASAAMVEDPSRTTLPAIVVREGRKAAAIAAGAAYDDPSRELRMIGITGTNGKSTTAGILRHMLDSTGSRAASIGTLGVLFGTEAEVIPGGAELTTPGPVELQRVLRELVDRGVKTVAMEVSSHSLDQRRIDGLLFDAAVFTNLTRDHLDYHKTMKAYFEAKARLMDYLKPDATAAVNTDDSNWNALPDSRKKIMFGVSPRAEVRATDVQFLPSGSQWNLSHKLKSVAVRLPLIGDVNVHNALGSAAVGITFGLSLEEMAASLAVLPQVPGRLEVIARKPTVLRDYAHTPDAIGRALAAIRPFTNGRLILVFGCGGDRDRGKRSEMGKAAEAGADVVIITNDNPRTEDPEKILDDIETGMKPGKHQRITKRRAAIQSALSQAHDGDVVLLAGKGHETYQIVGTTRLPFDEKIIVRELLAGNAA
ncbi:MAG TPA: UDP-N-acetylmuramoyl-L-alanyl-D-glutamate--2,6-diaminopimelate ligase [Gemmatimonadaceae bacterium]|nr:UDP-N-acetylmuramoyl-L-alanyl-D-glutamate--2,6-diaminopimelate ligase [Gemmatimonadaceae bacterium]